MFSLDAKPGKISSILLSLLPFVLCIVAYMYSSHIRHEANPKDRLVPSIEQLVDGFDRTAFQADRKGDLRLWIDTWASSKRIAISMLFIFSGVFLGLFMGTMPYVEKLLYGFLLFFDKLPALALLPILFLIFGLGETSKISLIVIGVMPTIALDTYLRVKAVPHELVTKARTLGASKQEILYRIVLTRVFPEVLDTIRLNFKAVILFLIAGEALASTAGLGYRIFLVRRYIAMDIIIPYVLWIGILAFLADWLFRIWIKRGFPWLNKL